MKTSHSALLQALLDATRGIGIRGGYKPGGTSGAAIRHIIRQVKPSLYPLSDTREQIDLDALAYSLERLPQGIEACSFIDIVRDESPYSNYPPIPVPKRREIAYRVSPEQMVLVVKGSKIRILDRITMLTCIYIEGHKLAVYADNNKLNWNLFEKMIEEGADSDLMFIQLARITGNPVEKLKQIDRDRFGGRLPRIIYDLGRRSLEEYARLDRKMIVTFSNDFMRMPTIGDVTEQWAACLEEDIATAGYADAPVYFISGNLDSFLGALTPHFPGTRSRDLLATYGQLEEMVQQDTTIEEWERKNNRHPGITLRNNVAATGLGYQLFFLDLLHSDEIDPWIAEHCGDRFGNPDHRAVLAVMDYPFGDDAFYYMNDVCKTFGPRLKSIGVTGRAAAFSDSEYCCVIPRAFVRQGDPQCVFLSGNSITDAMLNPFGVEVLEGNMLTVLGTFLQTPDVLEYFTDDEHSYNCQGLEMEGIHFANALESAKLRGWVRHDLPSLFVYYKSDNPLDPESTLARQKNMGERIVPKYAATLALLRGVLTAGVSSEDAESK